MTFATILLAAGLVQRPLITADDFHGGRYDRKHVRLDATVVDAFVDEIDPEYVFLVLRNNGEHLYGYICRRFLPVAPNALIGAEIAPWGVVVPPQRVQRNPRRQVQRFFEIPSRDAFAISRPAPDPFDAPDVETAADCRPARLAMLGRRSTRGTVLATWNAGQSILIAASNRLVRADLAEGGPPAVGDRIAASGIPETDLARINLSRAVWRMEGKGGVLGRSGGGASPSEPQAIALRDLTTNEAGYRAINRSFHGARVRLTGIAGNSPTEAHAGRLTCSACGDSVLIDLSTCPGPWPEIHPGDRIEATGVAVLDIDNCRPSAAFPQARGYLVVPAAARDVRVTLPATRPLPRTAWYVFGALVAAVFGIGFWNRSLRRLAHRRGKALAAEEIARAEADLRTLERTRLAVELHDSIAQNLTGVALEIETAQRAGRTDVGALKVHLDRAGQALASCRTELRNCLWDLRSEALEEPDMNEAIRRTLLPSVTDVRLSVRFNVPRARLTDNTAHALLRIIRELTINGIRHGGADHVQIAGTIERGRLLVSVRDNGRGFDLSAAPGAEEGHFGLEGIRERIAQLSGEFSIDSEPGRGTRATVALPVPPEETTP